MEGRMNSLPAEKEADITRAIRDYLNLKGIYHWKQMQGLGCKPGVADILGILPDGRFLAIEVKTKKGQLSLHQGIFLTEITKNNGVAFVAHSLDEAIEKLQEAGACPWES